MYLERLGTLLSEPSLTPIILAGDTIVGMRTRGGVTAAATVGSLSAYAKAFQAQHLQAQPGRAILPAERARACIGNWPVLRFVFGELVPHLRFLATDDPSCLQCPGDLERELAELSEQARALEPAFAGSLAAAPKPDVLARALGVPCAVVNQSAIPLERVTVGSCDVAIAGYAYRYCHERTRPLKDVLEAAEQVVQYALERGARPPAAMERPALNFLDRVERIVATLNPSPAGIFSVLYQDPRHQLQFSLGQVVLVRGPVRSRRGDGFACFGLPLQGRSRPEYLTVLPRSAASAGLFWSAPGVPAGAPVCMGDMRQYRIFCFERFFSTAESVTQWLNAGVLVYSGILRGVRSVPRAFAREHRTGAPRPSGPSVAEETPLPDTLQRLLAQMLAERRQLR